MQRMSIESGAMWQKSAGTSTD